MLSSSLLAPFQGRPRYLGAVVTTDVVEILHEAVCQVSTASVFLDTANQHGGLYISWYYSVCKDPLSSHNGALRLVHISIMMQFSCLGQRNSAPGVVPT